MKFRSRLNNKPKVLSTPHISGSVEFPSLFVLYFMSVHRGYAVVWTCVYNYNNDGFMS
jgi:hypothetical protein